MSAVFKHLEDFLRFNATRNMRLNDLVNELRKRDRDVWFHVVPVLKQTICVFVSGGVASFANRIPDDLLACVKAQAFNAFEKVGTCSTKMIAKTLKGNTKQDACRPRRIVQNLLGFVIWLLDCLGHVFRGRDANGLRPHGFAFYPVAVTAARRATANGSLFVFKEVGKETEANAFVRIVRITRSAQVLQRYIGTNRFQNREGFLPTLNTATRALTGELK